MTPYWTRFPRPLSLLMIVCGFIGAFALDVEWQQALFGGAVLVGAFLFKVKR